MCPTFSSDVFYGSIDGVKVALTARKIGKSGEPWCMCNRMSFALPILLGPVLFRTSLPCSGGYHLEREGMPLHNAVGIKCKKGATTF